MVRFWILLGASVFALNPATGVAQLPARLAIGAEATYWRLGGGGLTVVDARWGPTVHVGTAGGTLHGLDARLSLSYAPQASFTPGLVAGAVELIAYGWRPDPSRRLNLTVHGGGALLDLHAANAERAQVECTPERFCLNEGTSYRSGLRGAAQLGLGLDIGVTSRLRVQPVGQLVALTGPGRGGPTDSRLLLRLGIGVQWR